MKFEDVFSFDRMYKSGLKCCKGVRWKTSTQNFEYQLMRNVVKIRSQVLKGTYKSKGFHKFMIHERGKARDIESVHITERMVQKCLCDNYLLPRFMPTFIYDNGACLKGKGTGFAIKRIKTHLHQYTMKYGNNGYVLLFDIKNFFNSINHKILLDLVRNKIEDNKIFNIYAYFINCFEGESGLGLGSQVSQISASIYLNVLDHYIKDTLRIKYYGRYMDDGYIFSNSRRELEILKEQIGYVLDKLKLKFSLHKTQIVRIKDGFTFLKRRFTVYDNLKIVVRPNKKNIQRYKVKYKKLKLKKVSYIIIESLTKTFRGYLKEFNYYDRYTWKLEEKYEIYS